MKRPEQQNQGTTEPLVRPRAAWSGVALAIIGMVLIGWGLVAGMGGVTVAGAVLGLLGLGVAWWGGIMYDAHGRASAADELQDVEDGRTYRGVSPDAKVRAQRPRQEAREVARERRGLDTSPRETGLQTAISAAPVLLLALAAWTFFSQFLLALPLRETAVDTRLRLSGIAIALAFAALALRQTGPSKIALTVCGLCGAALIVSSFLAPHVVERTRWSELITGVLVLLVTALAAGALRYPGAYGNPTRGGGVAT